MANLFKVELTMRDLDKDSLGPNAVEQLLYDSLIANSVQMLSCTVTELEEPSETKT